MLHVVYLLLLVFITSCRYQTSQEKVSDVFTAQVVFNDSIHDFGTFSTNNAVQRCIFSFVNSGNIPAVILNASPSCQCISVQYTQEPVQPGNSGKIEVVFDGAKATNGYFNRSIKVRMNTSHTYILSIKGCME